MTHQPDLWQLIELSTVDVVSRDAPTYHILSSWYGGYLGSDSWRLSTQITRVEDRENHWLVTTRTGSQYKLSRHEHCWGTSGLARQILYEHPVLRPVPNDLLENT